MPNGTAQDSSIKWSWGRGPQSSNGESTPLLPSSHIRQDHADDETRQPLAPPPSSAPPPPPTEAPLKISDSAGDDTSQSHLSTKSKSSKSSSRSKRRKNAPDPTVEAVTAASSHIKNTIKKSIKKKFDGPRKSILHVLLDAVRLLAGLSSLMMLGMQLAPFFGGLKRGDDEFSFGLQVAVRVYIMIFCTFFILVEARLPFLKRFFALNWILRGFLYSFIGIIGMEQDLAIKVEDYASSPKSSILGPDYVTMFATLFMSLTTWLMISIGVVYMILGMACMQPIYERVENEHREKVLEWKRERKMEREFKRQKEEYRQYEVDRNEGRGEWYDDIPDA